MGGKFHPKLNTSRRPIANKYCEGKMKRTLKRELKVPEIAEREAVKMGRFYVKRGDTAGKGCRTERSATVAAHVIPKRCRTARSLLDVMQITIR